ncbi:phosphatidate cytidylyltransferase [Polaribacter litorisediminis]|uniref:phosphatidate cytidylyltransferase n=1 Tax=Polaribacter litorisediminis TaxID=1908341 RepID=UPI001CBEA076|nr:phosphatidate cytidylyltransferase [Polaribacter litorisediminis]UAM98588.1 phosphatidate cytidylyltransferase [Polaribacter litorisediminis]
MRNLLRRIFSGIVYILTFISAVLFSKESYIILISIFGFLSIWEFSRMIKLKTYASYLFFSILLFLMLKRQESYAVVVILAITIGSSLFLMYQLFLKKEIGFSNERAKLGISIRYVILAMCFLVLLPFHEDRFHPYLMIGILSIIWINDSFAFLIGKNFGKNKLFPSVSPKKTIEGFFGGLVFSLIGALLISKFNVDFSMTNWLIIGLIVSSMGTIGDLVESKFKRQAGIKDSGNIMPGHGGILDRLDSLLFVAPFVYLYINFII